MPEISPSKPVVKPAAASYCDLATYNAAILKVSSPQAADQLRRILVKCDEAEARSVVVAVLDRADVAQAQAAMTRLWSDQRPRTDDSAAMRAWWAREPQRPIDPDRWAAMSTAERDAWKGRVRTWLATGPALPPVESPWDRFARYARQHATSMVAIGVGLLAVAAAGLAVSRRGPRRLPSVASEIEEHGYDRYDHLRGE